MSLAEHPQFDRPWSLLSPRSLLVLVCLSLGLVTIVAIQLMQAGKPEIALAAACAPLLACAVAMRPQAATCLVLFLIYTNAPVVLMRYHGVPFVAAAAIPLLLLLPIGYHTWLRGEPWHVPRVTVLIVLFLVVQALGTIMARDPATALDTLIISLTEGVGLFVLLFNAIRSTTTLRQCVWALLAAGAFMGALCGHQYLTGSYERDYGGFAQIQGKGFGVAAEYGQVRQHRATGPIGVENRFAQIMLMLVPLGIYRFWGERQAGWRWGALVLTGCIAVGWGLAFSRGSAVGLVLAVGVMTCLGCVRVKQVAVFSAVMLGLLLLLPEYRARLATLRTLPNLVAGTAAGAATPDGAIKGRATEMLAAARVFADHPFIGVGPGMFRYYSREYGLAGGLRALEGTREAHCLYLAIMAEHGGLGCLCFLGILFVILRDLYRLRQRCLVEDPQLGHLVTGFLLAVVIYMTTGIFAHFSFVRYFWTIIALACASVAVVSRQLDDRRGESTA